MDNQHLKTPSKSQRMETLFFFNVRDSLTGKWRKTRYRLNENEARVRYGDGNYERLD